MSKTIHASPAAFSYAQALLELANEKQQAEVIGLELSSLADVAKTTPTFLAYLSDPTLSKLHRLDTLKRVLSGRLSPLLMNFIGVLNDKNRLGLLVEIGIAYSQLLDELLNKVEVEVTVAQTMSPEQLQLVQQKVSTALNKIAVLRQTVDESIIGGLILKMQDRMIDGSVKYQLQAMKEQLLATRT